MRNVVLVALAIAVVGTGAFSAEAQTPYVMVFFNDGSGLNPNGYCPPGPPGTVIDNLTVLAINFGMWMQAIEYKVDYGPALVWLADHTISGSLVMGSSPSGITIGYPIPQNAFSLLVVQTATVLWLCDDCTSWPDTPVRVLPHPVSGHVRAVRWPDTVVVEGVGLTSWICVTPYATEEMTWGQIKSLYE